MVRAPSTSVASITSPSSREPCAQSKKAHVTARRFRAKDIDKAKDAAKDAAKHFYRHKQTVMHCSVYVGNISPNVDEPMLIAHFRSCGKVLAAKIHCCGGVTMTSKPPSAGYLKGLAVSQYGIVTFASEFARKKALTLGGTLDGRKLAVAITISELPEVLEKIAKQLDIYRERMEPLDEHRARQSALRSLKMEPTVLLDPDAQDSPSLRSGVRILGVSLPGGIL